MANWVWLPLAARYYDMDAKRFMSRDMALGYVEKSINATSNVTGNLAGLVANTQLSPNDWKQRMREEIKGEYLRQYMLGRGGRSQMQRADWSSIGGMLAEQYKYLDRFADEIAAGKLSEAQIAMRAKMYIESAREGYERGRTRSLGIPIGALPTYPAAGSTPCLTNCKCTWEYDPIFEGGQIVGYNCYWRLESQDPCSGCIDNANAWNPFVVML